MCLVSFGLLAPNKIWPVLTFPHPGFSKFIGVRFAQPQDTNIYMIRFPWPGPPLTSSSLSPPSKPKNWMRDLSEPNKIWPGFTFTQPGFSKTCWVHFPQLHGTNVYRRVVSLGLESPTKYVPRFPWPSGPKLDMVYFSSAWFLKNLLGYVSLSFTASTCREESFHLALGT